MSRRGVLALAIGGLAALAAVGAAVRSKRPPPPAGSPAHGIVLSSAIADPGTGTGIGAIAGRVLAEGRPVARASILVTSDMDEDAFSSARCPYGERSIFECGCAPVEETLERRFLEGRGEAVPVGRTTTGADGAFLVAGLLPGRYAVWAQAGDGDGRAVAMDVATGGGVELLLRPGLRYEGIAEDEHGAPVAGARVAAIHRGHSRFFEATTDAAGRYRLDPLPDGDYALVASAPGHLPDVETEDPSYARLLLRTARRVEGRVVRDGRPATGAEVRTEVYCSPLATRTDREGRFVLEQLRPDRTTISAFEGMDGGFAEVELANGDRTGLSIELRPGGLFTGEVVDDSGACVAQVKLEVSSIHQVEVTTTTDAYGRFRIAGLPPCGAFDHSLWLHPPSGFVPPGHRKFRIEAGKETRVRFILLRASVLSGVVVDEQGRPVAEAEIVGTRDREGIPLATDWDAHGYSRAKSDRRGRFSLDHASSGHVKLKVKAAGFLDAELEGAAPGEVTVTLRRGGTLAAEVLDENGAPLAGAALTITTPHPEGGELVRIQGRTDARGRHSFSGLANGSYRVVAQAIPRHAPGEFESLVPSVATDAAVDAPRTTAVRLRFTPGLAIRGTVVEETTGHPLAGVRVSAEDEMADPPVDPDSDVRYPEAGGSATTGTDGRFEIRHLRPNRHALRASLEGFRGLEEDVAVHPGAGAVVLKLRREATLRGRVLDEDGPAIQEFVVLGTHVHAEDGRFAVQTSRTGEDVIRVEAPGFAPLLRDVSMDGHTDLDLGDLRLSRGRAAKVIVVADDTGQPLEAAKVVAGVARDGRPTSLAEKLAEARTGPDGAAWLRGLPAAPVRVVAERPGLAPVAALLAAEATELVVRLDRGGRIVGTVRNASGQPIRNVPVTTGGGSVHREGLTDEEGRFVLDLLPADDYKVHLQERVPEGNAGLSPRWVKLEPGATARVDFTESKGSTVTVLPSRRCFAYLIPGDLGASGPLRDEARRRALDPDFRRDGAHVFRGLVPGIYSVVCAPQMYARISEDPPRLRLEVGGADLEVSAPQAPEPDGAAE